MGSTFYIWVEAYLTNETFDRFMKNMGILSEQDWNTSL